MNKMAVLGSVQAPAKRYIPANPEFIHQIRESVGGRQEVSLKCLNFPLG